MTTQAWTKWEVMEALARIAGASADRLLFVEWPGAVLVLDEGPTEKPTTAQRETFRARIPATVKFHGFWEVSKEKLKVAESMVMLGLPGGIPELLEQWQSEGEAMLVFR